MRTKLLLLLCLFCSGSAFGQFTLVSGTVTDPNGLYYSYATITAQLVISGTPVFTSTNLPYTPPTQPVGLSSGGSFTMQLATNSALTPSSSTWTFQVCSSAGTVPPAFGNGPICFTVTGVTLSGSSQSLSTTLSSAAPALTAAFGGGGSGCSLVSSTADAVVYLNGSKNCTTSSQLIFTPQSGTTAPIFSVIDGSAYGADVQLESNSVETDLYAGLPALNDSTVVPKAGTLQVLGGSYAGPWIGGGANFEVVGSVDLSSISRTGNVVTALCSAGCAFPVGTVVNINQVTDSSYNGNFIILSSGLSGSSTALTWSQAGSNSSSSGGHIALATKGYNFFADAGQLNNSGSGFEAYAATGSDAKGNAAGMLFAVKGTSVSANSAGGPISMYAGDTEAFTGSPAGSINLTAGSSRGTGNNNGGSINLNPGTATESGTAGAVVIGNVTGSTQCLHVNSSGAVSGTGSDCGSGSGAVSSVTGSSGVAASPTTGAVGVSLVNPVNQTLEDNGTGGTTATPGQVFNIVSFGADPTGGSTIDTALAAAVTSCGAHTYTGGCIVYFPPGRYLISSAGYVLAQNSVTLMGANRGSTITQAAPTVNTTEYMIQVTGTNDRITGLTFAGQSTQATDNTTYQYCIEANAASSLEVDNNIFTGTTPGTNGCNVGFFDEVGTTGTQFILNNFSAPTIGTTGSKGYGVLLSGSEGAITNNVIVYSSTQGRHQIYLSQSSTGAAQYYVIANNALVSGTNVQIECNATDTGSDVPVMYNIIDSNQLVSTAFTNGSADTGAIDMNANCKFNKITNNKITTPAQAGISITGDSATTETGSPWTITGSCVRTSNVDVITATGIGTNLLPGQWITVAGTTGGSGVPATCNGSQFLVSSVTTNTVTFTQYGTNTTTTAATGTVTYNPARAEDNQISGNKITLPGATGIVCGACSRDTIENNTIYDSGTGGTYQHAIWLAALNTGQVGASFNRVTGNKVSGPNYFDDALVIDSGSVVTSSTNYVDGNYFPNGSSGSIVDNGTGNPTVYGTNYVNGESSINGISGGALESYPNAVTVSGTRNFYLASNYSNDMCATIEAAIAANGSGHTYNAKGFTGPQVCGQGNAYGNTTVMLYGGAAIGTEVDGLLLLSANLNWYVDGVASYFTDGVSNYGTPAVIIPWGFKIEYSSKLGHFVTPCTGTNTPVTGCTTAFPVRSFAVSATSVTSNTLTGTTAGIVNSGGPASSQNLYVKELAALVSPSCASNNLLRTIATIPGSTSFTIKVPSSTANCASAATLYLATPMFGFGLQNSGVGYEPIAAGQQAFGSQTKNVNVDLNSVYGLVGIQNVNQGEQSGVDGFYCRHPAFGCLEVLGGSNDSGPYDDVYMQTLAVTTHVNPTTFGIFNGAATRGYRGFTGNIAVSLNGTANEPNACTYNDGSAVAFTGEYHCEGPVDMFETGMDVNVGGLVVSTVISSPSSNPNVNQIHVVNDGFTVSGTEFVGIAQQSGGSTNIVLDDQNSVTIAYTGQAAMARYELNDFGKPTSSAGSGLAIYGNGALSSGAGPAFALYGAPVTGGSGTTNLPLAGFSTTGATAVSTWSTNGTFLGFNAPSGFTGNFLDAHLNGGTSLFKVDYQGNLTVASCSGCGTGGLSGQTALGIPIAATSTTSTSSTTPGTNRGTYDLTRINTVQGTAVTPVESQRGDCSGGGSTVSGATSTYTVLYTDVVGCTVTHDRAASSGVTVTIPTPTTLNNAAPIFIWQNDSASADTLTPTSFTIHLGSAAAGATLSVPANTVCAVSLDPFNASVWKANCHPNSTSGGGSGAPATVTLLSKSATYAGASGDFSSGTAPPTIVEFTLSAIGQTYTLLSSAPALVSGNMPCTIIKNVAAPYILAVLTGGSTTLDGVAFASVGYPVGPGQSMKVCSDGTNYHSDKGLAVPQSLTAAVGGFCLTNEECPSVVSATGSYSNTTNQVTATVFHLNGVHKCANFQIEVTGGVASTHGDWGIADTSGNLLCHTGSVLLTTTQPVSQAAATAIWLPPGDYYALFCDDDATHAVALRAWPHDGTVQSTLMANTGSPAHMSGTAATACTNGVLPATIGAVTNTTGSTFNYPMAWITP